jgi:hypothetical protein
LICFALFRVLKSLEKPSLDMMDKDNQDKLNHLLSSMDQTETEVGGDEGSAEEVDGVESDRKGKGKGMMDGMHISFSFGLLFLFCLVMFSIWISILFHSFLFDSFDFLPYLSNCSCFRQGKWQCEGQGDHWAAQRQTEAQQNARGKERRKRLEGRKGQQGRQAQGEGERQEGVDGLCC